MGSGRKEMIPFCRADSEPAGSRSEGAMQSLQRLGSVVVWVTAVSHGSESVMSLFQFQKE